MSFGPPFTKRSPSSMKRKGTPVRGTITPPNRSTKTPKKQEIKEIGTGKEVGKEMTVSQQIIINSDYKNAYNKSALSLNSEKSFDCHDNLLSYLNDEPRRSTSHSIALKIAQDNNEQFNIYFGGIDNEKHPERIHSVPRAGSSPLANGGTLPLSLSRATSITSNFRIKNEFSDPAKRRRRTTWVRSDREEVTSDYHLQLRQPSTTLHYSNGSPSRCDGEGMVQIANEAHYHRRDTLEPFTEGGEESSNKDNIVLNKAVNHSLNTPKSSGIKNLSVEMDNDWKTVFHNSQKIRENPFDLIRDKIRHIQEQRHEQSQQQQQNKEIETKTLSVKEEGVQTTPVLTTHNDNYNLCEKAKHTTIPGTTSTTVDEHMSTFTYPIHSYTHSPMNLYCTKDTILETASSVGYGFDEDRDCLDDNEVTQMCPNAVNDQREGKSIGSEISPSVYNARSPPIVTDYDTLRDIIRRELWENRERSKQIDEEEYLQLERATMRLKKEDPRVNATIYSRGLMEELLPHPSHETGEEWQITITDNGASTDDTQEGNEEDTITVLQKIAEGSPFENNVTLPDISNNPTNGVHSVISTTPSVSNSGRFIDDDDTDEEQFLVVRSCGNNNHQNKLERNLHIDQTGRIDLLGSPDLKAIATLLQNAASGKLVSPSKNESETGHIKKSNPMVSREPLMVTFINRFHPVDGAVFPQCCTLCGHENWIRSITDDDGTPQRCKACGEKICPDINSSFICSMDLEASPHVSPLNMR